MTESLILLICLNMQTPDLNKYYQSCVHALRAATIQTTVGYGPNKKSLRTTIDSTQEMVEKPIKDYEKLLQKEFERRTTNTTRGILGVAYGFFQKGSFLINSGFRPISDTITVETGSNNVNITLTWAF